jgi:putative aminopeptidase FrvX
VTRVVTALRHALQSASTEYFKKARRFLNDAQRESSVIHAVVNPDDVVQDNLLTACHNTDELMGSLLDVRAGADAALTAVAAAVRGDAAPDTAAAAAAVATGDEDGGGHTNGVIAAAAAPAIASASGATSDADEAGADEAAAGAHFSSCCGTCAFHQALDQHNILLGGVVTPWCVLAVLQR